MTISELLRAGLEHHQAGRLTEAEACYQRVLAAQPDHAGALHLLGGIAYQARRYDVAAELIGRAINRDGRNPIYFSNLGAALERLNKPDEAAAAFRQAVLLKPDYAEAHSNLGNALTKLKRLDEALASFDRALALRPDYAEAANNRGNVLLDLGRPEEALASYDRALALRPDYADALTNQAIVLRQMGRLDEALASYDRAAALKPQGADLFTGRGMVLNEPRRRDAAPASHDRATALEPDRAEAFNKRGIVLLELGRPDAALASFERAVALKPDHAEALNNRGIVLLDLGQPDAALASFERAVALMPDNAQALNNRGIALKEIKRLDAALASFDQALALKPDYVEAINNRGNVFWELGRPDAALTSYEQALTVKPDHVDALNNRGNALLKVQRPEAALASYEKALALRPDNTEALTNRGVALKELGRHDAALESYEKALVLRPDNARALNNRGNTLREMERLDEALDSFDRALALGPDYAEALNNRGMVLKELHRFKEALASFEKALALRPDYADAHFNEALVRLLVGDFEQGWAKNEWRWESALSDPATRDAGIRRHLARPLWLGTGLLEGKTILLHSEQGYGDTIQFCRYVPLVAARAGRVILEVEEPLVALMSNLAGVSHCIAKGAAPPAFDLHCPLLSLPLAFATRLETIPSATPYLRAPAQARDWEERLGPRDRPRVGLVWSGNPRHKNDLRRSIALDALSTLLDATATFVSLQREVRAGDAEVLKSQRNILDFGAELSNFAGTAALISRLDLIISVDTSVAHLAGALGRPVWILLPFVPDWRWLLDREDSPWYPTARLFRQSDSRECKASSRRCARRCTFSSPARGEFPEGRPGSLTQRPATHDSHTGLADPRLKPGSSLYGPSHLDIRSIRLVGMTMAPAVSPLAPSNFPDMPEIAGVRLSTAAAGIRYKGRTDVLLALLDKGTTVAGVFTKSKCPSAPVDWCREKVRGGRARVLVVNSGNANAFTGRTGRDATKYTAASASKAAGCKPGEVFLASTGVIGEPLDARAFDRVMDSLVAAAKPGGFEQAARAIMTTDTFPKGATETAKLGDATVTICGIAKGAGMIAPDMATMLSFVFTDAPIAAPVLQTLLARGVVDSFNAVTIDGDTSTSDTLLAFATGAAAAYGAPLISRASDPRLKGFVKAFDTVLKRLAELVARDGEGARKLVEVIVEGATSTKSARRIAMSIANSPLVKTAIAGEDANWGRVVMAVGKAGEPADRDRLSIWFNRIRVAHKGMRDPDYDEAEVSAEMKKQVIELKVALGIGRGRDRVLTCDLTKEYVAINGDYRS